MLFGIGLAVALSSSRPGRADQPAAFAPGIVSAEGCNAVAFSQLSIDELIGRIYATPNHSGCTGNWGLARFRVDWSTRQVRLYGDVAMPPFKIGNVTIYSAYDPFAVAYDKKVWVAFECAGWSIHTSVCVAPMLAGKGTLDFEHATRPIAGEIWPLYRASASVPKLLAWQGRLYLYWSVVREPLRDDAPYEVSGRGVELDVSTGRAWAKGAGANSLAATSMSSVEVAASRRTSPQRPSIADVFDVKALGTTILALVGRGGAGSDGSDCRNPSDPVPGCYTLEIDAASQPLVPGGFDGPRCRLPDQLKGVSMEYARLMRSSGGGQVLVFHETQPRPAFAAMSFKADCPPFIAQQRTPNIRDLRR